MLGRIYEWWDNNRFNGTATLVLVLAVVYGFLFGEGSPFREPSPSPQAQPDTVELRKILDAAENKPAAPEESEQAKLSRTANEYEAAATDKPNDEDSPAKLVAAGNLYMEKLNDPAHAAGCYRVVIERYPDWSGTKAVYPQLIKAYDLSNQPVERMKILMRMTDIFPPDTPEHQFAQAELGQHP